MTPRIRLLDAAVDEVVWLYGLRDVDWSFRVYPLWDAHDVLAHLVSWHESFAAIVTARSRGERPEVPRGSLARVNEEGVQRLQGIGIASLTRRLVGAQRIVVACSLADDEPLPYRRGSRLYTFGERLDIARGELDAHRRDVVRARLDAVR